MPHYLHPTALAQKNCSNHITLSINLYREQIIRMTEQIFGPGVFDQYVELACAHVVVHLEKIRALKEIYDRQACHLLVGFIEYTLYRKGVGAQKVGCFPLSRRNVHATANRFCHALHNLCKYQPVVVAVPTYADVLEWIGKFDVHEPHKWNICPGHHIPGQISAELYNKSQQRWMSLYAEHYTDSPGVRDMSVCYNDTDLAALREVFTVLDAGIHEASELLAFAHLFGEEKY
jgi:hypothetical protein